MQGTMLNVAYTGIQGLFYVLLLLFTVQTIILTYHWFKYGTSRSISVLALAIYLSGGAILLLTFIVAANTL